MRKLALFALLFALSPPLALADSGTAPLANVPMAIPTEGYLLDAQNQPVTQQQMPITFTLYDALTGGNVKWQDIRKVDVNDGHYAVVLGDLNDPTASALRANDLAAPRYLGVTVEGVELGPRLQLGSVPYAIQALDAQNLTGGTIKDATITSSSVDATSVSIGGTPVIDSNGQFLGTARDAENLGGQPAADYLTKTGDGSQLTSLNPASLTSGTAGIDISGNAATATSFTGALSGDVTGTQSATVVGGLQGVPLATGTPTATDVLRFDGQEWAPGPATNTQLAGPLVTSITAGNGLRATNPSGVGTTSLALALDGTSLATSANGLKVNLASSNTWTGAQTYSGGATASTTGNATSLTVRQTSGSNPTADVFDVTSADGNKKYLAVGPSGDVSFSGAVALSATDVKSALGEATSSADGYLSSTDWGKFNGKLDTVSVTAPLSGSGTASSPLTIEPDNTLTATAGTNQNELGMDLTHPNTWTGKQTLHGGAVIEDDSLPVGGVSLTVNAPTGNPASGTADSLDVYAGGSQPALKVDSSGNSTFSGVVTAASFQGQLATSDLIGTIANTQLASPSVTINTTSTSGLAGGGTVSLGGSLSLSIPSGAVTNSRLAGPVVSGVSAGAGLNVTGNPASGTGTATVGLATSGVTAGAYTKVTVDQYGRATSGTSLGSGDVTGALTYTPVNKAGDTMSGALSATSFSGSGAGLTNLNASNLASGIVPAARLSGSYNINAATVTNGVYTNTANMLTGALGLEPTGSATAPLTVNPGSGQTGDLTDWQVNSSTVASMSASGSLSVKGLAMTTSPAVGDVLTSDASGNATWQPPTFRSVQVVTAPTAVTVANTDLGRLFEITADNTSFNLPDASSVGTGYSVSFKSLAKQTYLYPVTGQDIDGYSFAVVNGSGSIVSDGSRWLAFGNVAATNQAEADFLSQGTYTWTVPQGVTSVSAVVVGGGGGGAGGVSASGGGGGGGGLCYVTALTVTPGTQMTVDVGGGGVNGSQGGESLFDGIGAFGGSGANNLTGGSGVSGVGGTCYTGGNGGSTNSWSYGAGGGGASGYLGNGGAGGSGSSASCPSGGSNGTGGGGGGGGGSGPGGTTPEIGYIGGSVGINGTGSSGAGGTANCGSGGGVGGNGSVGAAYGGGGPGRADWYIFGRYIYETWGQPGAVRIIWGPGRSFPYNAN